MMHAFVVEELMEYNTSVAMFEHDLQLMKNSFVPWFGRLSYLDRSLLSYLDRSCAFD